MQVHIYVMSILSRSQRVEEPSGLGCPSKVLAKTSFESCVFAVRTQNKVKDGSHARLELLDCRGSTASLYINYLFSKTPKHTERAVPSTLGVFVLLPKPCLRKGASNYRMVGQGEAM